MGVGGAGEMWKGFCLRDLEREESRGPWKEVIKGEEYAELYKRLTAVAGIPSPVSFFR